jgi:hypothetical protein
LVIVPDAQGFFEPHVRHVRRVRRVRRPLVRSMWRVL